MVYPCVQRAKQCALVLVEYSYMRCLVSNLTFKCHFDTSINRTTTSVLHPDDQGIFNIYLLF